MLPSSQQSEEPEADARPHEQPESNNRQKNIEIKLLILPVF